MNAALILLVAINSVQLGVILWMGRVGFDSVTNHMRERMRLEAEIDKLNAVARLRGNDSDYTYASKQATRCATCGTHKHTPLRNDEMGGYVCLTCIDKELIRLQSIESSKNAALVDAILTPKKD